MKGCRLGRREAQGGWCRGVADRSVGRKQGMVRAGDVVRRTGSWASSESSCKARRWGWVAGKGRAAPSKGQGAAGEVGRAVEGGTRMQMGGECRWVAELS
jgi:hypothetical protein